MEATPNERRLLNIILKFKIALIVAISIICTTVCAKWIAPEYRPTIVSNRPVVAGTAYQPSTTRVTDVKVSVSISCASLVIAGAAGNVAIQICSTSGGTYTTVNQITNSISGVLSLTNVNGGQISASVPAGYWYKIVNTTTTGSPTFSILGTAQETNL